MSTDTDAICTAFRDSFVYGKESSHELKDQWSHCCSEALGNKRDITTIDDVFSKKHFGSVAVPMMECQVDKLLALRSRRKEIQQKCNTLENWGKMKTASYDMTRDDGEPDPVKLPRFMQGPKGKQEFIATCVDVMTKADIDSKNMRYQLDFNFGDVKQEIVDKMGPDSGNGHWKKNIDNTRAFCKKAGYTHTDDAEDCCVNWVKNYILIDKIPEDSSDIDKSMFAYLDAKNKAAGMFSSLQAEYRSSDHTLHSECGWF
jgi:hypothetical protein